MLEGNKRIESAAEQEDFGFEVGVKVVPSEKHPEHSEDVVFIDHRIGVFGVFDGMGEGGTGSLYAAEIAKKCIIDELRGSRNPQGEFQSPSIKEAESLFAHSLRSANEMILEIKKLETFEKIQDYIKKILGLEIMRPSTLQGESELVQQFHKMGTTMSCVLYCSDGALIVHIGDSRVYSYTKSQGLRQETRDDDFLSLAQEKGIKVDDDLIDAIKREKGVTLTEEEYVFVKIDDETAERIRKKLANGIDRNDFSPLEKYFFTRRNQLWHHLGSPHLSVTATSLPIEASGDDTRLLHEDEKFVITCDGIHDNRTHEEIEAIMERSSNKQWLAEELVHAAQERSHERDPHNSSLPHLRAKKDDMTAVVVSRKFD